MNKKALIIVDAQNDFCPGGALAVREGDDVIYAINRIMSEKAYDLIVATIDWHPENHKSFASKNEGKNIGDFVKLHGLDQILWVDHCIQNSKGAELHPILHQEKVQERVYKGTNPEIDSYSGFFDNGKLNQTNLDQILKSKGIIEIDVVGLALDYCVKFTALDAKELGYKVNLILSATRAVNINPDDGKHAIEELKNHGINILE